MGSVKLSAVLVAHNEAAQLAACLETLRFADEIVVVLDRCTDDSAAIARRFTGRVIEGAWEIEGPRRMADARPRPATGSSRSMPTSASRRSSPPRCAAR
ncbi:MAG: glycosyltransferase [Pseudomonadota bacterium]